MFTSSLMSWIVLAHSAIQEVIPSAGNVPCIKSVVSFTLEQSAMFII